MQNRLKHLESLVKDVMTVQNPSIRNMDVPRHGIGDSTTNSHSISMIDAPDHDLEVVATTSTPSGQVLLGSSESTYVGATHWAAMLEDVRFFPSMESGS